MRSRACVKLSSSKSGSQCCWLSSVRSSGSGFNQLGRVFVFNLPGDHECGKERVRDEGQSHHASAKETKAGHPVHAQRLSWPSAPGWLEEVGHLQRPGEWHFGSFRNTYGFIYDAFILRVCLFLQMNVQFWLCPYSIMHWQDALFSASGSECFWHVRRSGIQHPLHAGRWLSHAHLMMGTSH